MEYQFHCLSNGIRIVHKYTDSNIAHCGLIINTGSRDELEDETGIAHFIEHCIFKGTSKRKSYHIINRIDSVGGDLNAYTTKEETFVYASFLKEYYPRTLELFADIVFNSLFPEKEINKEKDVVIEEISSYKDSPSELIFDEFEQQVFKNHSLGNLILGSAKDIKRYKSKNLINFVKRVYNTNEMVICSVGKIDFKSLVKFCEKFFGKFEPNSRTFKRQIFNNYTPESITKNKKTFQSHCLLGNIAYPLSDDRKTALSFLSNLLGGPAMNSRLSIALREKNGLSYNIEASYTPYSDTGLFCIYFGTDNSTYNKAVNTVINELNKLKNNKLGINQLNSFKKQYKGQIELSFDSNQNEMLSIGKSYLVYNKVDNIRDICKKIDNLNSEQILEVANEILDDRKLSFLTYKSK